MVKKINRVKKFIVCSLTSPLNVIALAWSFVLLIHLRASLKAKKQHIWLESQENAKIKRKKKRIK
jgi:hypothetical protein